MSPSLVRRVLAAIHDAHLVAIDGEEAAERDAWSLACAIEARGLAIVQASEQPEPEPYVARGPVAFELVGGYA